MHLRFVTEGLVRGSAVRVGVFAAAFELKRNGQLSAADEQHVTNLLGWFEQNLATPTRFNRTRSKGYYRRDTKDIAWFKSSATAHLTKIRELAELLERYGLSIETVKSDRLGYVVYEDEFQVVAEPFRDTKT